MGNDPPPIFSLEPVQIFDDPGITDPAELAALTKKFRVARRRAQLRRWLRRAGGVAALVLLGMLIGRFLLTGIGTSSSAGKGELLLANLTLQGTSSRSGLDQPPITLDTEGVYKLPGEFKVAIRSPRRGFATVVRLQPGKAKVYPDEMQIQAFQAREYGPLAAPTEKTTVLVIVTASRAAELIKKSLPGEGVEPDQIDQIVTQLQAALWQAGHDWAAIDRITVEPARKK